MLTLALVTGGREYGLSQLANEPAWQHARIKSPEGAASILVTIAKRTALAETSAMILPVIQQWYRAFIRDNGEPPAEPFGDWYEAHDDGVMALLEPYSDTLSASWLNFTSTDIRLWQDGEDEKLAKSFAEEVWKQLTWKRTDNQILAGVGIVHADLAVYGYMPTEPEAPAKPEYNPMLVNTIINRIMLSMPDPETLEDDLDFASDDDDALATGAAERLGISAEDVDMLREARSRSSAAVEAWKNAIEAGELLDETTPFVDINPQAANVLPAKPGLPPLPPLPGTAKALPPLPVTGGGNGTTKTLPPLPGSTGMGSAPPVNAGRGGRRVKTPEQAPPGTISLEILRSIKEHAGTKDEDMADLLGISRPTLANIMKGKGWYVPPDPNRRAAIQAMLTRHAQALMAAHDAIGEKYASG